MGNLEQTTREDDFQVAENFGAQLHLYSPHGEVGSSSVTQKGPPSTEDACPSCPGNFVPISSELNRVTAGVGGVGCS